MKWTDHANQQPPGIEDFIEAMLPDWFVAAVDGRVPESEILEKLRGFILEAEAFVAEQEGRPADTTPPTDNYVRDTYEVYLDILRDLRAMR